MNIIHVYCGDFAWCPLNIEIIGSITDTPAQMSILGKQLRPYTRGNETRRVFTNNENVVNGIRIAVKTKKVSPEQIVFLFMVADQQTTVYLDRDGNFTSQPQGFFEQTTHDLLMLL